MNRFFCAFLVVLSVFTACSGDGGEVSVQTKEQMLQNRWKVGNFSIDGVPLGTGQGNVDKIRITFTATTYTYVYPVPPGTPDIPANTMLTLEGTWQFNADKSKILLDRSAISQPVFEWTILNLAPGIFSARYVAQNPFNAAVNSNYDFEYTLDI